MNTLFKSSKVRLIGALLASSVLAGCASFSADGGFGSVEKTTKDRIGKDVKWSRSGEDQNTIDSRVSELLKKPLTVDDAVQIALLNNKGLQASFYELGISEADLVQAGRLPNPRFSMLRARYEDEYKIEQAFTFNVFSLITMPLAQKVEERRFAQTQRQVTSEVLRLAADTRKAYYTAISAQQTTEYMAQVKDAAEAGAELGRRMAKVGNWSKLAQAKEQGFYADAVAQLARSRQAATSSREQLTRLMGLWGQQLDYKLPERLPDLPKTASDLPGIESLAMEQRLDLQAIRLETEGLASNLGLTKATRFINVLELGPARVQEGARSEPYKKGYEIGFELPIFDWGTAKVTKAESIYMQALNRAGEMAVNARSEVRESYQSYRTSYDIAKHYRDEIVPLKKRISEENQLRYNGMLLSVFDLLADARSQISTVNGYIEALRDFWLAQADLDMALIGKPSSSNVPASMGAVAANEGGGH